MVAIATGTPTRISITTLKAIQMAIHRAIGSVAMAVVGAGECQLSLGACWFTKQSNNLCTFNPKPSSFNKNLCSQRNPTPLAALGPKCTVPTAPSHGHVLAVNKTKGLGLWIWLFKLNDVAFGVPAVQNNHASKAPCLFQGFQVTARLLHGSTYPRQIVHHKGRL